MKHRFLVNSTFLCVTFALVCVQLDTGLENLQLISGQKVCHYLGGDKGGSGVKK